MSTRKPRRRAAAASRVAFKTIAEDGRCVRIQSENGESYQVDFVQMQQRNLATGNRRAVRRRGGRWFFSSLSRRQGAASESFMKQSWQSYPIQLQPILEATFRNNAAELDSTHNCLQCAQGHRMAFDKRWNHSCNLCGTASTTYRCSEMCDYDLCEQCALTTEETSDRQGLEAMISTATNVALGNLPLVDASETCKVILTSSMGLPEAIQGLQDLKQNHGFKFSLDDVRRAAIARGSVALLQVVLCSEPQVQLLGMDIFDRRHPGLVMSDDIKACVRLLLTRGARLGSSAPASKLLRKVEADVLEAWAQQYFMSMSRASMDLPDNVRQQILNFLK